MKKPVVLLLVVLVLVMMLALALPAFAVGGCPKGGSWVLTDDILPQPRVVDRNGDGYVCEKLAAGTKWLQIDNNLP